MDSKPMTKKLILDFLIKYKLYVILLATSLLLFLSGFWYPFVYVCCVMVSLFYLTLKPRDSFKCFMFFLFFTRIKVFFVITASAFLLSLFVRYVFDLAKKRAKIFAMPLALTAVLLLVWSIVHYEVSLSGIGDGLVIIYVFALLYFCFVYAKQIDVKDCVNFFALGLVVSGIFSGFALLSKTYAYQIVYVDEICSRLNLLCIHTNHLSMNCLFLIAFEMYQIIKRKDNLLKCLCIIALALVIGLLTQSKAFIVVSVGFVGYILISLIVHYKLKSLRVILPLAVVFTVLCVVFKDFFWGILERFLAYNTGESWINKITTGRTAIWFSYMELSRSSILKMLFGVGLFTNELNPIGPHNLYLFILSRFGFIGIILIFWLMYSYCTCGERKLKISFFNILPILTFLILSLEEMLFSEKFIIFFVLGLLVLFENEDLQAQQTEDKHYKLVENLINKDIVVGVKKIKKNN